MVTSNTFGPRGGTAAGVTARAPAAAVGAGSAPAAGPPGARAVVAVAPGAPGTGEATAAGAGPAVSATWPMTEGFSDGMGDVPPMANPRPRLTATLMPDRLSRTPSVSGARRRPR